MHQVPCEALCPMCAGGGGGADSSFRQKGTPAMLLSTLQGLEGLRSPLDPEGESSQAGRLGLKQNRLWGERSDSEPESGTAVQHFLQPSLCGLRSESQGDSDREEDPNVPGSLTVT